MPLEMLLLFDSTKKDILSLNDKCTVEQDISADTLFSRLGDFAEPRILIFADAGTEHSSFIVLLLYFSFFH